MIRGLGCAVEPARTVVSRLRNCRTLEAYRISERQLQPWIRCIGGTMSHRQEYLRKRRRRNCCDCFAGRAPAMESWATPAGSSEPDELYSTGRDLKKQRRKRVFPGRASIG